MKKLPKSPEAHGPYLQQKIDELINYPEEYAINNELDRIIDRIGYNERTIRALYKEIERGQKTKQALEVALVHIQKNRKKGKKK